MTPARPVPPFARDALTLVGLQIGIVALMAGVLAVLPFDTGSGSWVGVVGAMIGAQSFVTVREKRLPGALDAKLAGRLAIAAAVAQLALGVLFFAVLRAVASGTAAEGALAALPMSWLAGVAAFSAVVAYGATRLGFRMGLKSAQRTRAPASKAR